MVDRFGDGAVGQVDQRIGELTHHGEDETVRFWQRVRSAIIAIRDGGEGSSVN